MFLSTLGLYNRNKTTTESSLNETSLGGDSFISSSSTSSDKDDGLDESSEASSLTTTSLRFIFRWYAVIVILSILVLTGIVFAVCRLSLKAEAFRKSGINSNQDSLLFSDYKASALPISLDLDDNNDL